MRAGIVAVLLVMPAAAPAQEEEARAILQRAVKAHGGEDRLARIHADRVKSQGTLFVQKMAIPFTAETTVQLPNQFKTVMEITENDRQHTIVHLINGDKTGVLIDGKQQKIDPAALAEMRDALLLDRIIRLAPLLRDRTFDLAPLAPTKINDRPVVGIKVTSRDRREFLLYFDKELSLLVKAEHVLGDGSGKQVREERYFGNFKEADGCLRPFKVVAYRDGKKIMEAEVTDVKRLDKIDDSEFTRP
jgi:hypothetical protein